MALSNMDISPKVKALSAQKSAGGAGSGGTAGSVLVQNVSKRFRKHTVKKRSYTTVKTSIIKRIFGGDAAERNELVALDNVSFALPAGKAIGIIGRNGSGKSTLLKLMSGIYRPSSGTITVNGRISALIELGAGFHPDFSGRENIYLGGVMFGLTRKEIDERFDEIVRFAELEDFIDDPVRTYSSGMYMRLGFSVAIFTDPEVLLVDEVLAVGDAAFVHRCYDAISDFKRRGKTLILVTHDLDSVVRWCDEAIWLEKGRIKCQGEPRWVVDQYLGNVLEDEERNLKQQNLDLDAESADSGDRLPGKEAVVAVAGTAKGADLKRWGNRHVEITDVRMLDDKGESKWIFGDEERVTVEISYQINQPIPDLDFGIGILRADGLVVHGTNTHIENVSVPLPDGSIYTPSASEGAGKVSAIGEAAYNPPLTGRYRYTLHRLGILEGSYYLDVAAHTRDGSPFDYHHMLHKFSVRGGIRYHGVVIPEHDWIFEPSYRVASDQGPNPGSVVDERLDLRTAHGR